MPNNIRTWLLKPVILAAALGLSGTALLATSGVASASTVVTGTTSMTNVPDTTNASGGACGTSVNGPTWSTDQFPSVTLSATLLTTPANTWDVTITSDGSYIAFADPTNCDPLLSEGNIVGSIQYTVTSATAPKASGLMSDYDGATEFSTLIDDFFGGNPTIGGGDVYNYSYQDGKYTQVGTEGGGLTVTGDVTPVPCTVTITNPGTQTSVLNTAITPLHIAATSNYPGTLVYGALNLPKGLTIDHSTGVISGTPTQTSTHVVTVGAYNSAHFNTDAQTGCKGTAQFNWTVSLTAPSPAPSPASAPPPPPGNTVPAGGVQTGGGKPAASGLLPFGVTAAVIGVLILGFALAAPRRQRQQG